MPKYRPDFLFSWDGILSLNDEKLPWFLAEYDLGPEDCYLKYVGRVNRTYVYHKEGRVPRREKFKTKMIIVSGC